MPTTKESQWPPRSPFEALLSSPSGRSKVRRCCDRASPSPLPLKGHSIARDSGILEEDEWLQEGDIQDDEETLQLKLEAIEAKLRLKKLQQRKEKGVLASRKGHHVLSNGRTETISPGRQTTSDNKHNAVATSGRIVQIEASPMKRRVHPPREQRSPGRVLLGIDKGLKGRNVSLRRPAEERSIDEDPFLSGALQTNGLRENNHHNDRSTGVVRKTKSFSERIAETRQQDKAQKERGVRCQKQRSNGFGISQNEIDSHRSSTDKESASYSQPSIDHEAIREGFSRDQIVKASKKSTEDNLRHTKSSAIARPSERLTTTMNDRRDTSVKPRTSQPIRSPTVSKQTARSPSPHVETERSMSQRTEPTSGSLFEPFSSLHLSKRLLPHDLLTKTFSNKSLLLLPDLLGAVKSPNYCLPDHLEADFVILAIIASKSAPLSHKDAQRRPKDADVLSHSEAVESEQNTKGNYMVLTLTDLKWTVDLFLFTTAYTRFRKLMPGTVIALLNPSIMPPLACKADTGRFSLTLNSSDDTVLEIGTSRDLGWCKSIRKDGKNCFDWIDKRHTEYCEFHVDRAIEQTRRGRMEVQGLSAPFAPGGRNQGRTGHFGDGGGKRKRGEDRGRSEEGFLREGAQYDRGSGSRYFIGPSLSGQSTAQLFDAEGVLERGGNKEERVRKRLAERERENEIARKLGQGGNGAGSDYLRIRNGDAQRRDEVEKSSQAEAQDVWSLGLMGNKASSVHLSPIKKRKAADVQWPSTSKKTRFVTDKGIREAGRESLGGLDVKATDDDDDGDLDIC